MMINMCWEGKSTHPKDEAFFDLMFQTVHPQKHLYVVYKYYFKYTCGSTCL